MYVGTAQYALSIDQFQEYYCKMQNANKHQQPFSSSENIFFLLNETS